MHEEPVPDPAASPFDHDERRAFAARLARDNGWSPAYAMRVVAEYERFLSLAMTVSHRVVPSDAVDQAWHLHLLHAKKYRAFCERTFGRPLDHAPSRGGDEHAGHVRDYERTLESYALRFGEPAPADIWPSSAERFDPRARWVRVNLAEHWLVRRPRAVRGLGVSAGLCAGAVGAALFVAMLASLWPRTERGWDGPQYLLFHVVLWALTLGAAVLVRATARRLPAEAGSPDLDPYEVAHLASGARGAVNGALLTLLARGSLSEQGPKGNLRSVGAAPAPAHPLEQSLYETIASNAGGLPASRLRARAEHYTGSIEAALRRRGLLSRANRWAFALALAAPLAGSARILSRVGRDEPIGFTVALTALGFVLALVAFQRSGVRTAFGDLTLNRLRERNARLRRQRPAAQLAADGTLPLALALFGMASVANLPSAQAIIASRVEGGAGCGLGGCGGGGGGGCGGCGGCGGG